jgi:hypothetical protein
MTFAVDPMPEMVSQRLLPAFMPTLPIIDPTCGRYCLKALLKHHFERLTTIRAPDITLPKPAKRWKNWVAYDPYDDFQLGPQMLRESNVIPASLQAWEDRLRAHGPIILAGVLGQASVPHYILLVGTNTDDGGNFRFKDPLAGDVIGEESFATMQLRIETPIVYARPEIGAVFSAHADLRPDNLMSIVFRN